MDIKCILWYFCSFNLKSHVLVWFLEYDLFFCVFPKRQRVPRKRKVGCSNPSRDRPGSYSTTAKHSATGVSVTGPSRGLSRVIVSGARQRSLTAEWPWMPCTGQNLQPFTGNGDVSISVKNSRVGRTNKRTKITMMQGPNTSLKEGKKKVKVHIYTRQIL